MGAGHNGLACAAYLARAGKNVLVLEARERVGGACTLHEVWPGHRISPCAYLAGLLHPLVIEELGMADYGFRWTPGDGRMFVPFDDGTSIQLWDDDALCEEEVAKLAPGDLKGWRAFSRRQAPAPRRAAAVVVADDVWIGRAPGRDEIEHRLGNDDEAREGSLRMVDGRIRRALPVAIFGSNRPIWVRGSSAPSPAPMTGARPRSTFTTSRAGKEGCRACGAMSRGGWAWCHSFSATSRETAERLCSTGIPVARIIPGAGVELAGGERVEASCVVSNADPRVDPRPAR